MIARVTQSMLLLGIALLASPSLAAPTAYYNPATGGIHLKNDTGSKLDAIAVYSETLPNVAKNNPSLYATIPGATLDPGDLPLGFTYLLFPDTGSDPFGVYVGEVILPGTPTASLRGVWYYYLSSGLAQNLPIIEIPEPSSLVLAACAATLLLRRRQPPHRRTNQ